MMRRCWKCSLVRSVALTVYGRHPLHFCKTCARTEGAKYHLPKYRLPFTAQRVSKAFNPAPLLLKHKLERGQ